MISLFISAQDIQCIHFGLVSDERVIHQKTYDVSPEKYLEALDLFLHEYKIASENIDRIFLVRGPGSFTANRVSVVIANTFAFVQNIPVVGLENPDRFTLDDLVFHFSHGKELPFAVPAYDRAPNIT